MPKSCKDISFMWDIREFTILTNQKLTLMTSNAIFGYTSGNSKVLLKDDLSLLLQFLQKIFKVGEMVLLLL